MKTYALIWMCAFLSAPASAGEPRVPVMPVVKARPADAFVESIGVNIRLGLAHSSYEKYDAVVKPRLLELGVRYIRDGITAEKPELIARMKDLAASGIHSNLVLKPIEAVTICKALPESVISVEGPDEPDRGGEGWPEIARANQKALWDELKGDPATKQIPVMGPGLQNGRTSPAKLGSLADWLDFGALHSYPQGNNPSQCGPAQTFGKACDEMRRVSSAKKGMFVTESGYHNKLDQADHPGIPEPLAARYLPRLLLYYYIEGIPRTYVFELLDSEADPKMTSMEKHFGLLRFDGTPKPAFIALKKTIEFFKDPGPVFEAESLSYKIEGAPKTLQQLLLQKRSGTFYLLLWLEEPSYDPRSRHDLGVPPRDVTLTVATPLSKAMVWYPLRDGDKPHPIAELKKFKLPVNDEILVVEMNKK